MRTYLKSKSRLDETNFLTVSGISVIIKDPIDFKMSTSDLKNTVESLPDHFLTDIDYIIFGQFDFLKKKGYAASYLDGAIYASNTQQDNTDILDDIIHEIGHSVEEKYKEFVYSDMELEREFLKKRNQLQKEFQMAGVSIPDEKMNNPEYDESLDRHFSEVVGYPNMTVFTQGIFYSPYGSTSLREYFANGFEAYFFSQRLVLKESKSSVI